MRTAIFIPNDVYEAAERLARHSKKSRIWLYSEALREYLSRHAPDEVTEAMNRVVAEARGARDPFVAAATRRLLERSEW